MTMNGYICFAHGPGLQRYCFGQQEALACSILTPHTESHSDVEAQTIMFFSSLDCRLD